MGRKSKYSDEQIIEVVKTSLSITDVMRKLGMKIAGGSHSHLKLRIKKLELDTNHFKKIWNTGRISPNRLSSNDILVLDRRKNGYKENVLKLRRAMKEYGFKKVCGECGLGEEWNQQFLTLQIDHINGNNLDNRPNNLRYICPNCHSQSSNWCWKNRDCTKN